MTTSSSILLQATTSDALHAAWTRIFSRGSAGGTDGATVASFSRNADRELNALASEIREGRYTPEPLQELRIPKGDGNEGHRTLRLPAVRDKVAQEAVRAALEPLAEATFSDCSYAYRPGRGPARAVRRALHHIRYDHKPWAALADIEAFFDRIDHERLLKVVDQLVHDDEVVRLVELWNSIGALDGVGGWVDSVSGVAQGGVLSPLLSNLYLTAFDREIAARQISFVRYADDFVLLTRTRSEATEARQGACDFLRENLGLTVKAKNGTFAHAGDGFTWLGVRLTIKGAAFDAGRIPRAEHRMSRLEQIALRGDWRRAFTSLSHQLAGWHSYYGALLPTSALALSAIG